MTWPRFRRGPFTASSLTWAGPTSRRIGLAEVALSGSTRDLFDRMVSAAEAMRNRMRLHGKRSAASSGEEAFQKALQREHSSKAAALHDRRQVARFRHGKGNLAAKLI
jgi:hypothetical protein